MPSPVVSVLFSSYHSQADYVLPVVRSLGMLLPGVAQRLFAFFHVDDGACDWLPPHTHNADKSALWTPVVEQFEPRWVKDFFLKEAGWAHHYSVMQRIKAVINLSICDQIIAIKQPSLVVYGRVSS